MILDTFHIHLTSQGASRSNQNGDVGLCKMSASNDFSSHHSLRTFLFDQEFFLRFTGTFDLRWDIISGNDDRGKTLKFLLETGKKLSTDYNTNAVLNRCDYQVC